MEKAPGTIYEYANHQNRDNQILKSFSLEEQEIISQKLNQLSVIPKFIGKDFSMPVELNIPGKGWHWDFGINVVRVDPKDLIEKPMDYLRFVMAHEGGHRRVSRTDFIPKEVWNQEGFPVLMNCIEDPRMNNFLADAYPVFREQMEFSYSLDEQERFEEKIKKEEIKKVGRPLRFSQAGMEYIHQWFRESTGREFELSDDLPDDVREVIEKTLPYAQDSWLRYPSKDMADGLESVSYQGKDITGEEAITVFAEKSYQINHQKIWPIFKDLVKKDIEDQRSQELINELIRQKKKQGDNSGEESILPKDLKDLLTEDQQKELQDLADYIEREENKQETSDKDTKETEEKKTEEVEKAPEERPEMSDALREKLDEYIESQEQAFKEKLQELAEKTIKEFTEWLSDQLQDKYGDSTDRPESGDQTKETPDKDQTKEPQEKKSSDVDTSKIDKAMRDTFEQNQSTYEKNYREVAPYVNNLTADLRNIFRERKQRGKKTGYKSGQSINISKRVGEIASNVPVHKTKAFERRTAPSEKDYAISLMVDLSGSMDGENIEETFKSVIVLAEVLNQLSIKTEITGFNHKLHTFQSYDEKFSKEVQEKMTGMLEETSNFINAGGNDDGYALTEASTRLSKRKEDQKFIIVLSDGQPAPSRGYSGPEYELSKVVKDITNNTDQKLLGLGLLSDAVAQYYPHHIAGVKTQEMTEKLADLLKVVIRDYDKL